MICWIKSDFLGISIAVKTIQTKSWPKVGAARKLARLKALSERVHGKFKNFMTQEDLRKMRDEDKWVAYETKSK
jgi:hypothetical protein